MFQEEVLLTPMYEIPSMPDVEKVIITADTVNKKEPPTYIRRENTDEPVNRPIQASGLAWGLEIPSVNLLMGQFQCDVIECGTWMDVEC